MADNVVLYSLLAAFSNGEVRFNNSFVWFVFFGHLNDLVLAVVLSFFCCFDRGEKQRECQSTLKTNFMVCVSSSVFWPHAFSSL